MDFEEVAQINIRNHIIFISHDRIEVLHQIADKDFKVKTLLLFNRKVYKYQKISINIMENSEQINLKLSKNLAEAARRYAKIYGYRNIQELANESIREKVFENNEFDETFSNKEIELIDSLIEKSQDKSAFVSEGEIKHMLTK
ncbi:hypothetical protein GF386_04775 [Candidatus Pacearchaeota archaeon]|nr:hypothetical protein [Candidatus Pacearchaeota archaeon]